MAQLVKNLPAMQEAAYSSGHLVSIPGSEKSSGERNGNPHQYLAWEIPWTEEPGGATVQVVVRVGHNLVTKPKYFKFSL